MYYKNIEHGRFLKRPNRFIAQVEIDGKVEICHVKNTGRCKELLNPHTKVYVNRNMKEGRKTKYDLVSVVKGDRLINIDSQAPNKAVHEWLQKGHLFDEARLIRPEVKYQHSRFDFYIETREERSFIEVKGVTLEEDGVALFPDAPTERGVRHVYELVDSLEEGYQAYLIFVVQMKNVLHFSPNEKLHPSFANALREAKERGVRILAYDCLVTENCMEISKEVEVRL